MKIQKQRNCTHRFTTRLSEYQFKQVKSKANPSDYIRSLIERDCQVVNDEKI